MSILDFDCIQNQLSDEWNHKRKHVIYTNANTNISPIKSIEEVSIPKRLSFKVTPTFVQINYAFQFDWSRWTVLYQRLIFQLM